MFFLGLCLALTALAFVLQVLFGDRRGIRAALRHGLAGGFVFTGVDHFVHTQERYVPMMPPFLSSAATELVYVTGIAEILGALGLVVPLAVYRRLGLPNLRRWAGFGLIALLSSVVMANINVAVRGGSVEGMEVGSWYTWLRPFLQPVIMLWVLYAAGIWPRGDDTRLARIDA
jgi:uncharacterized membrane protein